MKNLTVIRHGKAQPREPLIIPDRERSLMGRGRKDSRRMGEFYAAMVPDLIVSSPARRAFETATLFAEGAGYNKVIEVDERIYTATSSGDLLTVLREQQGDHVLIVGHNPPISRLVALLDGAGGRPIVEGLSLVTAACAHLVFKELELWQDLQENSAQLRALLSPRFLKALAA